MLMVGSLLLSTSEACLLAAARVTRDSSWKTIEPRRGIAFLMPGSKRFLVAPSKTRYRIDTESTLHCACLDYIF